MKTLNKLWWIALIRGIVLIILAIMVFKHPANAILALAIYISISLMLTGITQIFLSISTKDSDSNWGWSLAGGLIDVLFAFILLSNPVITAATLPWVVGFWIIVYGVMIFVNSFKDKKEGVTNWWLGLIGGLIAVGVGFVLTNNLLVGALSVTYWMGIGFLLAGIVSIAIAFGIKAIQKNI